MTNKVDAFKWYVLRVISGKEKKIKENIEREIAVNKWSSIVKQVLLPMEKVMKVQGGKKTIRERSFFPGYIMLEMDSQKMNSNVIDVISSMDNVIHFLGKEVPTPLQKYEVQRMLGKVDELDLDEVSVAEPYVVGEVIKIIDGPFNTFNGEIEEVHHDKKKLLVNVKIFGRSTPVELSYMQTEKIL